MILDLKRQIPQRILDAVTERLAAVEHERWAHWQRYIHSKCERESDGSLVIPPELVAQWERQITTPYADLSESEKESDRDQVHRYLPIIIEMLSTGGQFKP
jgi:hypothetical protein